MKKRIIYIGVLIPFLSSCDNYPLLTDKKTLEKELHILGEKIYFQAQKDALEGNILIKLNSDSVYVWTKSPWTDGTKPTFNPTYLDSKSNLLK
jgi:hypothetical protein